MRTVHKTTKVCENSISSYCYDYCRNSEWNYKSYCFIGISFDADARFILSDSWNEHLRALKDGSHRSEASHVAQKEEKKQNFDKKKSQERSKEGRDQANWDNYGNDF